MSKYQDIKNKACKVNQPGIFYAFNQSMKGDKPWLNELMLN